MQIAVRHQDQLMRDTVVWDVLQPFNTAQQYASGVCEGLGLRFDWYKSIVEVLEELLRDIVEVCGTWIMGDGVYVRDLAKPVIRGND